MPNGTYVLIGDQDEREVGKIEINGTEYRITETIRIDDKVSSLKELLNNRKDDHILVFRSFTPFREDLKKLQSLAAGNRAFFFEDFKKLDTYSIDALLEFLQISHRKKSEKIKSALKQVRKEGIKLGNPGIADNKGKAIRTRKLYAFIDESVLNARRAITAFLENSGAALNYSHIAEYLNDQGLKPRRGKQFYAKTVQRLLESKQKLEPYFQENEHLENVRGGDLNQYHSVSPVKDLLVTGLQEVADEVIEFEIRSPLQEGFEVIVRDNQATIVYQQIFGPEGRKVLIDLDEHVLLPGRHYIGILTKEEQYQPFHTSILLRQYLLELA